MQKYQVMNKDVKNPSKVNMEKVSYVKTSNAADYFSGWNE